MLRKSFLTFGLAAALATTSLSFFAAPDHGFAAQTKESKPAAENNEETLKLLNLFGDVFEKVRESYVEKPEDKQLIESAINGMLTALDPHSSYLDKEAFKEMQITTTGEFGGLGIEVTLKNGLVYVVSPIDDTPAFKAGMQAGDYVSHIDGESVIGMSLKDAVGKMRGKPKTPIVLTVIREGEEQPFDVTIVRDIIHIQSVRSHVEAPDIVYLRITSFADKADDELKKALDKRVAEIGGKEKLKGVVLDLRNDPGGLLDQAIAVSDMFLDHGEIVSTRGRDPEDTHRFNATAGDVLNGLPMVVLINGGSASASEIVAGALQDQGRAVLMGTKSFGKGSVQTVVPLPGDSAIRLTTSRYYTPSGRSIQATGIEPDITVEPAKVEAIKVTSAARTTEATLPGHLANPNKPKNEDGAKPTTDDKKETPGDKKPEAKPESKLEDGKTPDASSNDNDKDKKSASGDKDKKDAKKDKDGKPEKPKTKIEKEEEEKFKEDYQLQRAVDLLHGISVYRKLGTAQDVKH